MHSDSVAVAVATLHVRNVPDELYELLRARAAENDRSLGAEAIQLLQERLAFSPQDRLRRLLPTAGRRRTAPFSRFTPRARQAVAAAQEQARAAGHRDVDTGHLLLGVLLQEEAPVVGCLHELGVTLESARAALELARPRQAEEAPAQIPFQPGAKKALELALRQSLELGHTAIGCEHLVLGIVGEGEGPGSAILREAEPDEPVLRRRLLPVMRFEPQPVAGEAFRVLALAGGASDWEKQLNEAAALGYDLVQILGERAILQRR
jgi:plasmid stability protein